MLNKANEVTPPPASEMSPRLPTNQSQTNRPTWIFSEACDSRPDRRKDGLRQAAGAPGYGGRRHHRRRVGCLCTGQTAGCFAQ